MILNLMTEEMAIRQLPKGDVGAFNFFYDKYHQAVYANIFKFVKQKTAADDLLQDVFLALWENREKTLQFESVANWLFTVSFNKAMSYLKKSLKDASVLISDPVVFKHLIETQSTDEDYYKKQLELLLEAIENLPKSKQRVFKLCYAEGKSIEDAAVIAGISTASVRDYLKQASKLLKIYVQKHEQKKTDLKLVAILFIIGMLH